MNLPTSGKRPQQEKQNEWGQSQIYSAINVKWALGVYLGYKRVTDARFAGRRETDATAYDITWRDMTFLGYSHVKCIVIVRPISSSTWMQWKSRNYNTGDQHLHSEERPTFQLERLNDLLSDRWETLL
jgi:hypothetical protein